MYVSLDSYIIASLISSSFIRLSNGFSMIDASASLLAAVGDAVSLLAVFDDAVSSLWAFYNILFAFVSDVWTNFVGWLYDLKRQLK